MESNISHEASVSVNDDIGALEGDSGKIDLLVEMSFSGELNEEFATANEILTRVNLDLACASEKLDNLSVLMMHVDTKESDFEAFASALDQTSFDTAEEALEFDLLSGFLESEAKEMDKFLSTLQMAVIEVRDMISSYTNLEETITVMEEKLCDSENSLKQSCDQVSEIVVQSAKFQRALGCLYRDNNGQNDEGSNLPEDGQINARINMQTAEQQRNILRLLEKSLAKEIDLEKRLTESKQTEEEMKHRLQSMEHELIFVEEEVINVCERWFEGKNAAEVLTGISKELLSRLQVLQFNLNGSVQREVELKAKLEKLMEQLEAKENSLQKSSNGNVELNELLLLHTDNLKGSLTEVEEKLILANSESFLLKEKFSSLEKKLKDSGSQVADSKVSKGADLKQISCSEVTELENSIQDLKEKLSEAESRADGAETTCKLLMDTNMDLNEELGRHKVVSRNVELLERQLKESEMKLQHAVASAEASQERQNMLNSSIHDMENVIENLKAKVLKAENRSDSAEDNCIILSETNAELTKKVSFLRSRVQSLEASLNQAEDTKITAAMDIGFQIKVIRELLVQLAIERERLHKQIGSLSLENKTLKAKLKETNKDPFVAVNCQRGGEGEKRLFPEHEETRISSANSEMAESQKLSADIAARADTRSEVENVGRVDARLLNCKHVSMALLVLLLSAAVYLFQPQQYYSL